MDDAGYERQRQANIAANLALLEILGLTSDKSTKKSTSRPKVIRSNTSEESQERRRSERNIDKNNRVSYHVKSESIVSESISEEEIKPTRLGPLWKMYKPKRIQATVVTSSISSSSSNSDYKEDSVEEVIRMKSGRVRKAVLYSDDIYSEVKKHYGKRSRFIERKPSLRDFIVVDESSLDEDDEAEFKLHPGRQKTARKSSPLLLRQAQRLGNRIHNPKRFGHIPGVPVGSWWATRMVSLSEV